MKGCDIEFVNYIGVLRSNISDLVFKNDKKYEKLLREHISSAFQSLREALFALDNISKINEEN